MTERRPNPNRKDENIRRANRVIQTRSFVLMLVMGVGMFVLLFFQLFDLQIVRHEELQSKAVNQQTRRTVVTASRGTIYDRSGNIMAISASAETVILSPLVAGGVVVLLAMVVVLMLGYVTLTDVSGSVSSIKRQISDLDEQHVALLTEYEKTFDLATIKAAAEAAGIKEQLPKSDMPEIVFSYSTFS